MTEDKIEVAIRVRPLIPTEIKKKLKEEWNINGNELSLSCSPTGYPEVFTFDYIFDTSATNKDLYKIVAPLVHSAVNGFNCTIFAYGQTSSGKTHSIIGSPTDPGIIPLAVHDIFQLINNDNTQKYVVRVAYVELYNEKINDLLNTSNKDLKIRMDENNVLYINAEEKIVCNESEMTEMLQKGNKNKQIGETKMNERSSRSHVICDIIIESYDETDCEDGKLNSNTLVKVSHLYIVDLAGSERIAQTGATGVRLNEGVHINKSLSVLITVINQLSTGQPYVSFRDSKLTRLLSNALGGNSKTLIITAITPASVEDTLSTLKFARSAKTIKNKPRINEIVSEQSWIKRYQVREKELLHLLTESKQTLSIKDDRIKRLEDELHDVKNIYVKKKSVEDTRIPRRHTVGCLVNNLQPILETSFSEVSSDMPDTPSFVKFANYKLDPPSTVTSKNVLDLSIDEDVVQRSDKYRALNETYEDLKAFRDIEIEVVRSEKLALEVEKREQEIAFKDRTAQLMKEIEELKNKCNNDMKHENEELKKRCAALEADNDWITHHQKQRYESRCEDLLKRIDELESNKNRPRIGLDTEREENNKHLNEIFSKLKDNYAKVEPYENGVWQRSMSFPNIHKAFSEDDAAKKEIFHDIFASLRQWCSTVLSDSKDNSTFNALLECLNNTQVNDMNGLKRNIRSQHSDFETINGNLLETESSKRISDMESKLVQSTELAHLQTKIEALQKELSTANAQNADLNKELLLLVPQLGQFDKLEDELCEKKEQINQLNKKLQHFETSESQKVVELEKVYNERIIALTAEYEQHMKDKNNICEVLNKQVELLNKEKDEHGLLSNAYNEAEKACKDLKEKYAITCAEYEDTIQDKTKQLELCAEENELLTIKYEETLKTISALKMDQMEVESLNNIISQKSASESQKVTELEKVYNEQIIALTTEYEQLIMDKNNICELLSKQVESLIKEKEEYCLISNRYIEAEKACEDLHEKYAISCAKYEDTMQDKTKQLELCAKENELLTKKYEEALETISAVKIEQTKIESLNTVISQKVTDLEKVYSERILALSTEHEQSMEDKNNICEHLNKQVELLNKEKEEYYLISHRDNETEKICKDLKEKYTISCAEYEETIQAKTKQLELHAEKIELLTTQYEKALETISALKMDQIEIESLKNIITQKSAIIERLEEELKELQQHLKVANEKYAQYSTNYESVAQLNSEVQTKMTDKHYKFQEEISALKDELTATVQKYQNFEDILKERNCTILELNNELTKSKIDLENMTRQSESNKAELLKTHKDYDFVVKNLKREISQKDNANVSDSTLLKDLKVQYDASVLRINEQLIQIKTLEDGWNQEKYLVKQSKDEYNVIMSEYQELLVRHETLEKVLAEVKQHGGMKQDREKINELENAVDEQNQLVEQLQLQLDKTQSKLENITMGFQTLSVDFQMASAKVTQLEIELNSAIKEKDEVSMQRKSEFLTELETTKNLLIHEKMLLEQSQSKYAGLQADYSKLLTDYQAVKSELTGSVSLSKHETEVNKLTRRIHELESFESSMNKIHQRNSIEIYEQKNTALLQQINELGATLEKSEECLREAQKNDEMKENTVMELQRRVTIAEREKLRCESVVNEKLLHIKSLKKQINNMSSIQNEAKENLTNSSTHNCSQQLTESVKKDYEEMKTKYKVNLYSVVKRRDELETQVYALKEKNQELEKVIQEHNEEIKALRTEVSISKLKTSIRSSNQNKTKEIWIRVDKELYNIIQKINLIEEMATFCTATTACDRCQHVSKELHNLKAVVADDEAIKQLKLTATDSSTTRAEYITFFRNTRNDLEHLLQHVVLPVHELREFITGKVLHCYDNQIENYHAPLKNLQSSLEKLNDVLQGTSSRLKQEDANINGIKCSQCAIFQNCINIINSLSNRFCYDLNLVCQYPDSEFEMEFSLDSIKRIDKQMEFAVLKYREFQLNNAKQPCEELEQELDALKERYARLKRLSQQRYQQIQNMAKVLKQENYTLNFKHEPMTIVKQERVSETNGNVESVPHEIENPRPPHGKLRDNSTRKSLGATPKHLGPFFATPEEHREQLRAARRYK